MRTLEQVAVFKARLHKGLLSEPMKSKEWIRWHSRQGMFADLERERDALESDAPEPIRKPQIADSRPLGITREDYEQLRGQVNFLDNKVMEMRVKKKKGDRYEHYEPS